MWFYIFIFPLKIYILGLFSLAINKYGGRKGQLCQCFGHSGESKFIRRIIWLTYSKIDLIFTMATLTAYYIINLTISKYIIPFYKNLSWQINNFLNFSFLRTKFGEIFVTKWAWIQNLVFGKDFRQCVLYWFSEWKFINFSTFFGNWHLKYYLLFQFTAVKTEDLYTVLGKGIVVWREWLQNSKFSYAKSF